MWFLLSLLRIIIQEYGEECKHPVVAGPATVGCGLLRNRDLWLKEKVSCILSLVVLEW